MISAIGRRSAVRKFSIQFRRIQRGPATPKWGSASTPATIAAHPSPYRARSNTNDPDPSLSCAPTEPSIVIEATRSGSASAMRDATAPPIDHPSTCARSILSSSIIASSITPCPRGETSGTSTLDAPNPGRSIAITRRPSAASIGPICAKPAQSPGEPWIRSSGARASSASPHSTRAISTASPACSMVVTCCASLGCGWSSMPVMYRTPNDSAINAT